MASSSRLISESSSGDVGEAGGVFLEAGDGGGELDSGEIITKLSVKC